MVKAVGLGACPTKELRDACVKGLAPSSRRLASHHLGNDCKGPHSGERSLKLPEAFAEDGLGLRLPPATPTAPKKGFILKYLNIW